MLERSADATRQYIDAVAAFEACEEALKEAAQVRGGMYWHKGPASGLGTDYLIRTSTTGHEKSPGPRSPETEAVYEAFLELLDAPGFSAVIVATNGDMARMNTLHPTAFIEFKRWMSNLKDRDALKRRRDALCKRRSSSGSSGITCRTSRVVEPGRAGAVWIGLSPSDAAQSPRTKPDTPDWPSHPD